MKLKCFAVQFLFYLILIVNSTYGQEVFVKSNLNDVKFIPIKDDFTQSGITSIYKDSDGFIWISTYGDGLFRYNGIHFKKYLLQTPVVHTTYQDSQGNIWIGTEIGLYLYKKELDVFEKVTFTKKTENLNISVHAIIEYDKNSILLGTHQYGLYKLNKKNFSYEMITYNGLEKPVGLEINSLVKTIKGRFLVGSNKGLMTFDPYNKVLKLAKFNTKKEYIIINESIVSMLITQDGSIWSGTFSSGVIKILDNGKDEYNIKKFNITNKRVMSMTQKSKNIVLCGTENDGLFEINFLDGKVKNLKHNKFIETSIKSNSIWSVFKENNRVWVGYYSNGIDTQDDYYNKFESIKSVPYLSNSLSSSSVTGIEKDKKNRFWISMIDGGVDVYDINKNTLTSLLTQENGIAKGFNRLDATTIFIDSKNNVWVGTWNFGLFLLKENSKTFININSKTHKSIFTTDRVMSFAEDSKGTIWIGTFLSGLYSYNPSNNQITHHNEKEFQTHSINTSSIRKVIIDYKDQIWIATIGGVFKIKKEKGNFLVSSLNDVTGKLNTSQDIISSIFEDFNHNIWFGTLGNGLFKFNTKTNNFIQYNKENGLIHENIFSITQTNENILWVGGNQGLSKLNLAKNSFTNFTKKDGLLSNSFNHNAVFRDNNNTLYFGTTKGINYFNPEKINYSKEKPIVYLSDLRINNELIEPQTKKSPLIKALSQTQKLIFNHNQNSFSIDYFGINYTRGENNIYSYYLEGYDKNWNNVGSSQSANYKNIPPGNYTFKVKAANNDGLWNETPTIIIISVLPAWWKTNIAYLIYLTILLLISYYLYGFINTRIQEKRTLALERQVHKQFEALNNKKIQFFTNISHEFRTPLTLILTPLEDIIEKHFEKFSDEIKDKHNTIYKNAKRLSRMINELMDFRKFESSKLKVNASKINLVSFIKEVISHFKEEALLKNIALSVKYNKEDLIIWADPSMLEKIIFNLLSNAFKATPKEGAITIQINDPKELILLPLIDKNTPVETIEIVVKDTGLGIKKENLDKVFDRFFQANEMNDQYYTGTGIGLELVKSFVKLHKGKITLTSQENIGTVFSIYFPKGHTHFNEDSINKSNNKTINQYSESNIIDTDEELNEVEKNQLKKVVLIVEDNAELRTYIKNELKKEYHIKEAENGLEGYEKSIKYMPDLIITDVMMPIMDGFEFCEKIKNDLKTSHIPILMVTAKGMEIDKIKGIDSGADVYLNKPFNMTVLQSHLKQLITSRQILFDKYFNGTSTSIDADNTTSLDKEFINKVLRYINVNISDEKLNVEHLASELFLSRSKLYRKIKALTGDTANEFIRKVKLEKAKQIIENSQLTMSEICYQVGFSSPSYFTKCFKDHFGVLPTEIRNQ